MYSEPSHIAVCIANDSQSWSTLPFRMMNYTPPYRVSCYFVDYNTSRRNQLVSLTVGDHTSDEYLLTGESFQWGQWVTWEIHELPAGDIININIQCTDPNWVISALMIDPMIGDTHGDNLPIKLSNIDSETRGEWMSYYGEFGGIIFTSKPIVVSSTKEEHSIDILFTINKEETENGWIYGYDWVKHGICSIREGAMNNPCHDYGLNIKG